MTAPTDREETLEEMAARLGHCGRPVICYETLSPAGCIGTRDTCQQHRILSALRAAENRGLERVDHAVEHAPAPFCGDTSGDVRQEVLRFIRALADAPAEPEDSNHGR